MHGLQDPLVPWDGTGSSDYTTDHVLPSVRETTNTVAAADGCRRDAWSVRQVSSLVDEYTAEDCAADGSVAVFRPRTLGHEWATGPAAVSTYGVDEAGMAWTFMLGAWRTEL